MILLRYLHKVLDDAECLYKNEFQWLFEAVSPLRALTYQYNTRSETYYILYT